MNHTLSDIINDSQTRNKIRKSSLRTGDTIFLKTLNSTYKLKVLGDNQYLISGGWFDRNKLSPVTTTINGCTWGSSVILNDTVAACGLQLEFGNKVITSRIEKIFHVSSHREN